MNIAAAAKLADITYDEAAILQTCHTNVLLAAAAGKIDLNAMARAELANRGLDTSGKWVGFREAAIAHGIGV
jgi:hypothetical protein